MYEDRKRNEWLLPGAILLGGILLAGSLLVTRYHQSVSTNGHPEAANPLSTKDHVLGNPTASIIIIEYADIDSPYAKDFQQVMQEVATAYGANGSVAWVFRHFPQASTDPNAEEHAEAAECVNALGGTHDFFSFIAAIQNAAPDDNIFDPKGYDSLVQSLSLSVDGFNSCLSEHTYKKVITDDFQNALAVGAAGSPYSIIQIKGQKPIVISGSVPFTTMKQIIDSALSGELNTHGTSK